MTLTAWYSPDAQQDVNECIEYFESRDIAVAEDTSEEDNCHDLYKKFG